jgi:hypothetical protein
MTARDNFDNSGYKSDNEANNVEQNENDVLIRKEDLKRLNDPGCLHINVKRDDSDTIGDTVAWVCMDCGRGAFLPKHVKKII